MNEYYILSDLNIILYIQLIYYFEFNSNWFTIIFPLYLKYQLIYLRNNTRASVYNTVY